MANVKSVTQYDNYPNGDNFERRYTVVITPNNLVDESYVVGPYIVPDDDTANRVEIGDKKLQQLADNELGSEKVAQYQEQNDYDRRALGQAMTWEDVIEFHATLPLFLAVEVRGGSNANARAAYLGTTRFWYDQIANRYGDDQGVAFFLDNAKGQVWEDLPAEFE